ncbi:MAG: hypothetical protein A2Y38_12395 [Spirochaetes bacterium GWB1_59_5]|nr:MAG: hypothetical protein A2Y38_12395 [Spirochaetes bacterium GWB1_59_5]
MAGRGSPPGVKYGGREKGTPNKSKNEVLDLISAACPGWNPLQAMARAAMTGHFAEYDPVTLEPLVDELTGRPKTTAVSDKTRGTLLKEVNEYCYAKRKAVEVTGADGEDLNFGLLIEFVAADE